MHGILNFQFKTAWTSPSFVGISMIMNKKSHFTKIFSQAILDMKDKGRLDIFHARNSHKKDHSCNLPDAKQKPLGFKKIAFLFVALGSGIFISILVVLFEFIAQMYSEKQKFTIPIQDCEISPVDDYSEESVNETEKAFQKIIQKPIKTSQSCVSVNNLQDFTQAVPRSRIPIPSVKKVKI